MRSELRTIAVACSRAARSAVSRSREKPRVAVGMGLLVAGGLWLWAAAGGQREPWPIPVQASLEPLAAHPEFHDVYLGFAPRTPWSARPVVPPQGPPRRRVVLREAPGRSPSALPSASEGNADPRSDRIPASTRPQAPPAAGAAGEDAFAPLRWDPSLEDEGLVATFVAPLPVESPGRAGGSEPEDPGPPPQARASAVEQGPQPGAATDPRPGPIALLGPTSSGPAPSPRAPQPAPSPLAKGQRFLDVVDRRLEQPLPADAGSQSKGAPASSGGGSATGAPGFELGQANRQDNVRGPLDTQGTTGFELGQANRQRNSGGHGNSKMPLFPDGDEDLEIVLDDDSEQTFPQPFQFISGPPMGLSQPKGEGPGASEKAPWDDGVGPDPLARAGADPVGIAQVSSTSFLLLAPEPSTALLLGAGLVALGVVGRRRRSG